MSKYIDAGKLKYEIERRNLSERYTTERYEEELYEIIDSLEDEQPVEGLEEEIARYLREECSGDDEPSVSDIARHFAEWGAEHLRDSTKMIPEGLGDAAVENADKLLAKQKDYDIAAKAGYWVGTYDAFIAGAEWQKDKILKLIELRTSEILGDAQPNPILRLELQDTIDKIK